MAHQNKSGTSAGPARFEQRPGIIVHTRVDIQESLFAPHTISFTSQGVAWSCPGQNPLPDNYLDQRTVGMLSPRREILLLSQSSATRDGRTKKPRPDLWRLLVYSCSARLLTFLMDRLPAISGATTQFDEHLQCRYLAGHWYDDLPQSLAWSVQVASQSRPIPIPRGYFAPSWSWASMTYAVKFPFWGKGTNGTLSAAAKLMDIYCDVPGRSPYGRVSSGFIESSGKTVPIVVTLKGSYATNTPDWDFEADSTLRKYGDSVSRAIIGEIISDFEARAFCLYLASLNKPGNSNNLAVRPLVTHYALALGWLDSEQTSYHRVGLMTTTTERAMALFDGAVEKTANRLGVRQGSQEGGPQLAQQQ